MTMTAGAQQQPSMRSPAPEPPPPDEERSQSGGGSEVLLEVQVCSDVHLDEDDSVDFADAITPVAPVLLLAGDIGNPYAPAYARFLGRCSAAFRRVFLVAGNHEYHLDGAASMAEVDAHLAAMCGALGNVTFLNCAKASLGGGLAVVGLTLWSHVPRAAWPQAQAAINDYKRIRDFTPQANNALHARQLEWLTRTLHEARAAGERLLVVTHHVPSMDGVSLRKYATDPLRHCYKTRLDHLISLPTNALWVCGHTHFSFDQLKGKTRFVSNQFRSKMYRRDLRITLRCEPQPPSPTPSPMSL
jgi:predicted phosphodiesterase